MKLLIRSILIVGVLYVGVVVAFESLLAVFQPANDGTIVLTMTADDGTRTQRILSPFDSGGQLYLAANHWPRNWFTQVQKQAVVSVKFGGQSAGRSGQYAVRKVDAAEQARVAVDTALPLTIRILTGFPPRKFVRLEPMSS